MTPKEILACDLQFLRDNKLSSLAKYVAVLPAFFATWGVARLTNWWNPVETIADFMLDLVEDVQNSVYVN